MIGHSEPGGTVVNAWVADAGVLIIARREDAEGQRQYLLPSASCQRPLAGADLAGGASFVDTAGWLARWPSLHRAIAAVIIFWGRRRS
jgi:hypothetical protein